MAGIYTLEFQSLSGKYKYVPGQFLHLALDSDYDGTGQWPDSRCFSMQSNPDEETIRISYAVKGAYTKQMEQKLKVGSVVWLKLPYGDLFTQPHKKINTVFIAGGTGITPFLSLFTHESFNEYINPKIYLGFRSKEFNIYQDELARMQKIRDIRQYKKDIWSSSNVDQCNSSKFVKLYHQDSDGVIDIAQIFKEIGTSSTYFISGPPSMIRVFKQLLIVNEVPIEYVITDEWE